VLAYARFDNGIRLTSFMRSFFNQGLADQNVRQGKNFTRMSLPLLVVNLGTVAYILTKWWTQTANELDYSFHTYFLLVFAAVMLITAARFAFYAFLSWLFDLGPLFEKHTYTWMLNATVMSMLLLPAIVLVSFGPSDWQTLLLQLSIFLLGIFHLIRGFRIFFMLQKDGRTSLVYNIFYLCALEFLPPALVLAGFLRTG